MSRATTHPPGAKAFIASMAMVATACFVVALIQWQATDPVKFLCYLAVAVLASSLKIKLPGITGTMSVNFLFILLGILELGFAETMLIGFAAVLVQCYWKPSKPNEPIYVLFNLSQLLVGTAVAYGVYHFVVARVLHGPGPLALLLAAVAYFVFNTLAISVIIRLTEGKPIFKVWSECYFWSFPYYLVGAAIVGLVSFLNRHIGWQSSLLVLPPVYLMYRSYRLYLGKLEDEKRHAEQVSTLHLRTIEALALAIEAKDHTTHEHLQRVRIYAMELAQDLGLNEDETEALRAASVLHDIGKLAVPEHIVSKPGKLTPEEFEKMKIHPIIGAEILEQVEFPYPVVPIVHSHHEKWDGSGYPDGLKGEAIPIGARILAAVDCLDALASDRQYRRALPLDEAMARVAADAGKSFDPRVVDILQRRYVELEKLAHAEPSKAPAKLSKDIKVERGLAPAAGFAETPRSTAPRSDQGRDYLASIAAARQEVQGLFELSHELGTSLSLDDTLSMLSVRLKRLVPYDSMAVYLVKDDVLTPEFVSGDNFRLFSSLSIPVGQGLSGWVAQNNKPILNGNPSVEPGYLNDPEKYSTLRSALAVPLAGASSVVAVLALYRSQPDAFTKDHLRILLAIASKLGFTVENALKYQVAEDSATTDFLTDMPNGRSLFVHLDGEIARCQRSNDPLAVFVADLDGFKQVNDRLGHLQGNKLLQMFATFLKDSCREYDYAARMGGDEFVVVAPGLHKDAADEMAERLESIVAHIGKTVCSDDSLSVSVGQAFYPADGSNAEELLAAADRRMYGVKKAHHSRSTERAAAAGLARARKAGA
ncbi:MAG TPA: HD domain-containing phosphohydrolase [Terriglobales bacterium]|jgi:diguanylate cyclase (GGDEF)-like protein/putative nucleotidyltransferase with HDIG domain|nr:HD domain-containing phosphohydrolase [Terriglobales bacterium]